MNLTYLTEGISRTPYQHQLDAVEFFHDKKDGNLFFSMGTGKTGTAILIYRNWCKKEGRLLRCLIVAPPVVLHNWKDEFSMFSLLPKDKIVPLVRGTGKQKAEYVYNNVLPVVDGMVVNVNYEALLNEELFKAIERWNPEVIIFDEVHMVKNSTAKRSKLCTRLAEAAQYRLGLTGTPILKNSQDMYGIFRTIDLGKTFGTNVYVFQAKYLIDKNARNPHVSFPAWIDNAKTFPELQEKIYAKSIRKLMSECIDLPPFISIVKNPEWGADQKKAYDELKRDFLTFIATRKKDGEPESVTASLAVVKAMRMLQVASGFVTTDEGNTHEFKSVPRLDMVKELLAELTEDNKVIIWCSYVHNYTMLARVCDELKIKYVKITGQENTSQKREAELDFRNNPDVKVVIANRASAGIGINLVEAKYSIVYSRNFSLGEEEQSTARNYRGGSQIHDKIIKIDLAIKDSLDEQVLQALKNKKQISTEILDLIK